MTEYKTPQLCAWHPQEFPGEDIPVLGYIMTNKPGQASHGLCLKCLAKLREQKNENLGNRQNT